MTIFISIILLCIGIGLWFFSQKNPSVSKNLETIERIASIVAVIAAIIIFAFPGLTNSSSENEEVETIPTSTPSENATTQQIREPFRGPENGTLVYETEGIQWQTLDVSIENFTMEIDILVPDIFDDQQWNAVIFFRNKYRVWLDSTPSWGHGFFDDEENFISDAAGISDAIIQLGAGERNKLSLIVKDDGGCLFINDQFVGTFDVDDFVQSGDIAFGIDSSTANVLPGTVMQFENLTVFTTIERECP